MVSHNQNDTRFYPFFAGAVTGCPGSLLGNDFTKIVTCANDCATGIAPSDPGWINRRGLWGLEELDP